MHSSKQLHPRAVQSRSDLQDQSQHSSQTDLSDVGLCSLNIHEFTYNTLICLVCMKQWSEALQRIDFLLETVPKKYSEQLWLLRALIK